MSRWTPQQVRDAAPDDAGLKAARKLATPGPWSQTGSNDTLLWGQCQGSGKTPYQVSVDLIRPAYRCSCPSRKFPCKHALALLMLWSENDGGIEDLPEAAEFAADWAQRSRAGAKKSADKGAPADPEAQARRREQRLALMDQGMEDFLLWLSDLARTGLAAARSRPASWWEQAAARLVDAQLPGLADEVRALSSGIHVGDDWADRSLTALGRWWSVGHAWRRREQLDAATMADLRVVLGWGLGSDEVAAGQGSATMSWTVLGSHRSDDGRVQEQRTWVWCADTEETALLLDFGAGGQALPPARNPGSAFAARTARYPGHPPVRILLVEPAEPATGRQQLPAGHDIPRAAAEHAETLAANPWARRRPTVLRECTLTADGVLDAAGYWLPYTDGVQPWALLADTGGHPATVFGELEDGRFRPLATLPGGAA